MGPQNQFSATWFWASVHIFQMFLKCRVRSFAALSISTTQYYSKPKQSNLTLSTHTNDLFQRPGVLNWTLLAQNFIIHYSNYMFVMTNIKTKPMFGSQTWSACFLVMHICGRRSVCVFLMHTCILVIYHKQFDIRYMIYIYIYVYLHIFPARIQLISEGL